MQHVITPHMRNLEPFAWWDGAFTEQELTYLQQQAMDASQDAQVGQNGGSVVPEIRRSEVNWVEKSDQNSWVFEKLGDVAASLNADYFGFDLFGFGERLQLTNYHQDKQGMYGWHQDFGGGVSRKLSLVLQLTDPSEYEGGNLELMISGSPLAMRKQRGLIIAFPSWALHQVTPVTRGTRQSLVAWVSGPNFK